MSKFGALPPPEFSWQIGKTAGVIVLVGLIEDFIKNNPTHAKNMNLDILKENLKSGKQILETKSWLTLSEDGEIIETNEHP